MAIRIILNAKTQRIGVCNACESLVIHEKIVDAFMPKLAAALQQKDVVIHADEKSLAAAERREAANGGELKKELLSAATEEDWGREYLDYMISVKTVSYYSTRRSHTSTATIPGIRRQSSQKTTRTRSGSWMRSMLPASMSTHRRVFQTDLNLDLARRSASVPRSFTQEDRWDWMR